MGITLFNGKVIILQKAIKSSHLILPTGTIKSLEKAEGEIVSMADDIELDIKVGDYICYGQYAGYPIPDEAENRDDKLIMLDAGDILYKKDKPVTEDKK